MTTALNVHALHGNEERMPQSRWAGNEASRNMVGECHEVAEVAGESFHVTSCISYTYATFKPNSESSGWLFRNTKHVRHHQNKQ